MAVDHRVGFGVVQLLGRFALLSFLREDAHAPAVQVLNQPGVMHIQARICAFLAGPAVPGHAAGLPIRRWHVFVALPLYREAEGLEVKPIAVGQYRAFAVMKAHVSRVGVVGEPREFGKNRTLRLSELS